MPMGFNGEKYSLIEALRLKQRLGGKLCWWEKLYLYFDDVSHEWDMFFLRHWRRERPYMSTGAPRSRHDLAPLVEEEEVALGVGGCTTRPEREGSDQTYDPTRGSSQ